MQKKLDKLKSVTVKVGLRINEEKMKILTTRNQEKSNITLGEINKFCYTGSMADTKENAQKDINRSLGTICIQHAKENFENEKHQDSNYVAYF